MVLRPVHLVVSVLRLHANQVPFCKHGTISYPLKDACRARNLPWYDFERLPFVVLVQSRRDGTSAEAMVNMQTILRAKQFIERTMECKYNPRQTRPFYRFVGEQWMAFSNENLAALQRRLSEPDRPSTPAGLRVVLANDIHARADKVLRFNEFCNCLESGFTMADELWKSFRLSRSGEGADTTETGQDDLWEVIENFVVGQAVDAAADRHNGEQHERRTDDDNESNSDEIDVNMRHVLNCAVVNGWLLPAAVNGDNLDSTGEPNSVLLRCCEELEMLGREFGNDEGVRAGGISAGAVCRPQSERPEDIRRQGIARSALLHIPMPGADRENPLPESTPGYMQMASPEVFRSGDTDPHQNRKLDDALSTGDFAAIDELYVRVINGTLRHTGHSGRGDASSAKDGCAVRRQVVDKAETEADGRAKQSRGDGSVEYALKYTMKPVAPIRTTGDMLLSAMERREASDNVDIGVVQNM
ncbi:hypothetical protein FJT64_010689 [Amphibalanus amphitrite]|uniref:Uncharacterized protein n=1 Tax=Amphibalanus amphitrite TaxID=1232801 RepID=A0A6A4VBT0_AMPAM|nr:hypothetical protein FJT64_010689 [Amphibalanus amphitrite]